ncbi:F-box domain containing protein [Pandoravirus macleodensis]|uniref:F-box domain containing protein n=1 Tax=Pandoravirus macleodensis TaxID=2107707 RepID=A0A2U7UFG3_9VIRU|nr:F-box domain containing protein [Pandoravirus macleodensis]AVK77219.1 F-box domain containing protein [Pandoravirus macleodensis]
MTTANVGVTSLPAELMCALFEHLDAGWRPLAAQVCQQWRACVRRIVLAKRDRHFDSTHALRPDKHTLALAVRGGHVGVVTWMAGASGRVDPYPRALAMTQWVASALSTSSRSWRDVLVAAAHDQRADILLWDAGYVHDSFALCAAVVYASDQLLESVCRVYQTRAMQTPRPPGDSRVFGCAVARGNINVLEILVEIGFTVGLSALFLAALCRDNAIMRVVRTAFYSTRPDVQRVLAAVRWLRDQHVCVPTDTSTEPDANLALVAKDVRLPWRPYVRVPSPIDLLPGGALGGLVLLDDDPLASVGRYLDALVRPLLVGDSSVVSGDLGVWIAMAPLKVGSSFGVEQQVGRILRTGNVEPVFVHIGDFERGYSTRAEGYLAEMACGRR